MTIPQPWSAVRPVETDPLPDPRFPRSRFLRKGYAAAEVDAFVRTMSRCAGCRPSRCTVSDVVDQRFKVRRHGRRYPMRAVDDYLDHAVEVLRDLGAEPGTTMARPVRTGWIYLLGVFLSAVIVGYAATQLWL